jgi:hypothetical protein
MVRHILVESTWCKRFTSWQTRGSGVGKELVKDMPFKDSPSDSSNCKFPNNTINLCIHQWIDPLIRPITSQPLDPPAEEQSLQHMSFFGGTLRIQAMTSV